MNCTEAKPLLSSYADSAMTGKQVHAVSEHLGSCAECRAEVSLLVNTQQLVAGLGRKPAPPDLALKLRVLASRELAASRRKPFETLLLRWQNALNAFMVPATCGMVTAVLIFGLLIGMLMPAQLSAANDVPTNLYTPPELSFSPFGFEMGSAEDSLVVEASIDANGRVQDYRILSSPESAKDVLPELKNMLIFTQFRPATSFGRPTNSRAILTFARINVKG